ncbi:hypothetical protein [Streptomyces sp. NPDC052114]|uniref:hypothetical protein n=1 Tax=unclassified Streptomyces TaxID=2593676 RepID=UPI0034255981
MSRREEVLDLGALGLGRRGEADDAQVGRVRDAVREGAVRDLYVVVHGAHNDPEVTAAVDGAFRALLAEAWDGQDRSVGMLGVHWPSLCFRDEGLPGLERETEQERAARPGVSAAMAGDLERHLPESAQALARITGLLDERPAADPAFDDLGTALRRLAQIPLQDPLAAFATDTEGEVVAQADPLMLFEETRTVCAGFAGALHDLRDALGEGAGRPARHESGGDVEVSREGTLQEDGTAGPRPARALSPRVHRAGTVAAGGPLGLRREEIGYEDLWLGAHELFRQVVRHVLRRRAALVGEWGLGPCLPAIVDGADVRLHLVGHGLGGRLAGFALRGLEAGGCAPVMLDSLTILQGELSHFAFADSLPQQVSGHGALWGFERLVRGPLICSFSHLDGHLGVLYPLSAQMIGDSAELATTGRKWGALGFDGIQGTNGPPPVALADLAERELEGVSYVNVDVSEVVRSSALPMGGHHCVFDPQMGQLLRLTAGG